MSSISSDSSDSDIFDPVGIFLASSGTRGDRLLFRHPTDIERNVEPTPRG